MFRWIGLATVSLVLATVTAYSADTVTSATVSSSTVVDKTPPTASSPGIVVNNNDVCQTGLTAALQTGVFGVSGGTTIRDLNCERIKLARSVFGMGLKVAGISILCQEVRVFDGLWMAGSPCPFMGKIGEAAKEEWLDNVEMSPVGSIIRPKAKKRARKDWSKGPPRVNPGEPPEQEAPTALD
jgi:hypothetical protein|tara:strand:+ start:3532 stop:4080 length:549 start_codon:yes stop_codon:yes gene_type:complete